MARIVAAPAVDGIAARAARQRFTPARAEDQIAVASRDRRGDRAGLRHQFIQAQHTAASEGESADGTVQSAIYGQRSAGIRLDQQGRIAIAAVACDDDVPAAIADDDIAAVTAGNRI